MRSPFGFMKRYPGWTAGLAMLLLGAMLILSDRMTARHIGERPWMIHPKSQAEKLAAQAPWPKQLEEITLPVVKFHFYPQGSRLSDIVDWIESNSHVYIEVNWRALERANIGRQSPMSFDGTNVPLPKLLDA